jgi:hypothetical protein
MLRMMAGPRADISKIENDSPCYLKFPEFDKLASQRRAICKYAKKRAAQCR